MKITRYYYLLFFLFMAYYPCTARVATWAFVPDSTTLIKVNKDSLFLWDLARRRTDDFQQYVQQIADKSLSERLRKKSIALVNNLFSEVYIAKNGSLKKRSPRILQQQANGKISYTTLNKYLKRLYKQNVDYQVKIVTTKVMYYTDYQLDTQGKYRAMVHYGECDEKHYQELQNVPIKTAVSPSTKGDIQVYLGDITMLHTQRRLTK